MIGDSGVVVTTKEWHEGDLCDDNGIVMCPDCSGVCMNLYLG